MIHITPVFRMSEESGKEKAEHAGWKVFDDTPPGANYGIYLGYPQAKEVALDLDQILYDSQAPIKFNATFIRESESWISPVLDHWRQLYVHILSWKVISQFTAQELANMIAGTRANYPSAAIVRGETRKDRATPPITIARLLIAEAKRQLASREQDTCDTCILPTECCTECNLGG